MTDELLNKVLRTIVGIPIVLLVWPITFGITAPLAFLMWIFKGEVHDKDLIFYMTLPYQFLKKVWKL